MNSSPDSEVVRTPGDADPALITRGPWSVSFGAAPTPGYCHAVIGAYPVALVVARADAALITNAPNLLRMVRVALEVCKAQLDPEHVACGNVNWESLRDELQATLDAIPATEISRR